MTVSDRSNAGVAHGAGRTAPRVPPVAFVYLAIIVLTWAGNWPLMKLALSQVPPLKFVLLRLIGSLVLIAPALLAARLPLMPAAMAGQVVTLTPIGGFVLSLAIFGGPLTLDVVVSIVLIVAGIFVTLRR